MRNEDEKNIKDRSVSVLGDSSNKRGQNKRGQATFNKSFAILFQQKRTNNATHPKRRDRRRDIPYYQ